MSKTHVNLKADHHIDENAEQHLGEIQIKEWILEDRQRTRRFLTTQGYMLYWSIV